MRVCYIIGAADASGTFLDPSTLRDDDYVIAADGGYKTVEQWGIKPDQIIGDFDSLGFIPDQDQVLKFPSEKDDTDMMIAVKLGLKKDFSNFIIYGGLGGRLDHTIANIHVLEYLVNHGARGCLIGRNEKVFLIQDESLSFEAGVKGIISIFAYGGNAEGVYLTGLKYPLENAVLTTDFPIGVSNEFTGIISDISVRKGKLLVIQTNG